MAENLDNHQQQITLIIADDQELYRESLHDLIIHWKEFLIVGMCANGLEATALYRDLRPNLIILDVRMPQMNGVEATHSIIKEFPFARVVMMSISNNNPGLFEAIQAGACGYFLKNVSPIQLRQLLHGWAAK
jgi:two-component system nitrate/nitrite response regulator NarL